MSNCAISQICAYEPSIYVRDPNTVYLCPNSVVYKYGQNHFNLHGRILTSLFLNLLAGRLALTNLEGWAFWLASRWKEKKHMV